MLHSINLDGWDSTAWCVPSCVSILTGAPVAHTHSRAAFMMNESLKDVAGVDTEAFVLMLREQGHAVRQIDLLERFNDPPTLTAFMKARTQFETVMPLAVTVHLARKQELHMVSVHMGWANDNWTKRPVPIEKFPHRNAKVVDAFMIVKG